jgi:hypothetical protein
MLPKHRTDAHHNPGGARQCERFGNVVHRSNACAISPARDVADRPSAITRDNERPRGWLPRPPGRDPRRANPLQISCPCPECGQTALIALSVLCVISHQSTIRFSRRQVTLNQVFGASRAKNKACAADRVD